MSLLLLGNQKNYPLDNVFLPDVKCLVCKIGTKFINTLLVLETKNYAAKMVYSYIVYDQKTEKLEN